MVDVVGRSAERWVRMVAPVAPVAPDDNVLWSEGPAWVVSAMANATNEMQVLQVFVL